MAFYLYMKDKMDFDEIDIDKLLDDVGEETILFIPAKKRVNNYKISKLAKEIADNIFLKVKGKAGAIGLFDKLLVSLEKLNFSSIAANIVFDRIRTKLSIEQKKFNKDDDEFTNYKHLLMELEVAAKGYFKYKIYQQFQGCDLPEKLKLVKRTLLEPFFPEDEYRKKALIDIQEDLETEIALRKEELEHRQKLVFSNEKPTEKENLIKNKDLNKESATLFMTYLFDSANIDCDFTKKAEVIEFLTGFSKKQIVKLPSEFEKQKLQIEDGEEASKRFLNDLEIIRKYFKKLGATEIVEKIDKDLGN